MQCLQNLKQYAHILILILILIGTDSVPRKVASRRRRRKRLSTEVWCYDKAFTLFWKSKASLTCAALGSLDAQPWDCSLHEEAIFSVIQVLFKFHFENGTHLLLELITILNPWILWTGFIYYYFFNFIFFFQHCDCRF